MWSFARIAASRLRGSRRLSTAIPGPCIVHKRGADILHDPWFNKDTGFPLTERDRLGLRGLLPPRVISFEHQYDRFSKSASPLSKVNDYVIKCKLLVGEIGFAQRSSKQKDVIVVSLIKLEIKDTEKELVTALEQDCEA